MVLDTAQSTLSYNGVIFDSLIKSKVSGKPVLDDAKRTVKYVAWTIDVTAYVTADPGENTDATILNWRHRLTAAGKQLRYNTKGFGALAVNGEENIRDVNWGPIPELFSFTPVGNDQTVRVEWRVTTYLPECSNAVYEGAPLSFNYECNWGIDDCGYTVLRTTGSLEIPQSQYGGMAPDIADAYRQMVRPEPILGFKREQTFSISKNHSKLDFSITDTELAQPLPDNVGVAEIDHTVKGRLGYAMFQCSLSGTIRVQAGKPKTLAWDRFKVIVESRLGHALWPTAWINERQRTIIIDEVQFREQVFGRDSSFTVNYRIVGTNLTDILRDSGLWQPIKAGSGQSLIKFNHRSWLRSMTDQGSFDVRGNAGLNMNAVEDPIVDLCNRKALRINAGVQPRGHVLGAGGSGGVPARILPQTVSINPAASWIDYTCLIELQQRSQVARHKPLEGNVTLRGPSYDATGNVRGALAATDRPGSGYAVSRSDVVQEVSSPTTRLRLFGFSRRMQYAIEPPQLVSVGQYTPTEISRTVKAGVTELYGGVPIYTCTWSITYDVPGPVEKIPVVSNPLLLQSGLT